MNGNIGNMGDMGSVLSKLLEDPESLGKVMNIASALSSSGALSGLSLGNAGLNSINNDDGSFQNEESNKRAITGDHMQTDERTKQTYQEMKHDGNSNRKQGHKIRSCDRIRLLEAMRPFLSEDKRDKLEVVIKILGLADAAGGLYGIKK